jgi:hypothetical protein
MTYCDTNENLRKLANQRNTMKVMVGKRGRDFQTQGLVENAEMHEPVH